LTAEIARRALELQEVFEMSFEDESWRAICSQMTKVHMREMADELAEL